MGIKIEDFIYATDFKRMSDKLIEKFRGNIKTMVASGIHFGEHYSHSTILETMNLFQKLDVKHGYISHISHLVSHKGDAHKLHGDVHFVFDGMLIDL